VHDGRVELFEGDLDDYHRWLLDHDKAQATPPGTVEPTQNSAAARKDLKRREAEFRQSLRPLKQRLDKLETQLESLQGELDEIALALADPAIYQESAKAQLTTLLSRQGPLKQALEGVELEWMSLGEEIEQKEQDFAQSL